MASAEASKLMAPVLVGTWDWGDEGQKQPMVRLRCHPAGPFVPEQKGKSRSMLGSLGHHAMPSRQPKRQLPKLPSISHRDRTQSALDSGRDLTWCRASGGFGPGFEAWCLNFLIV